MRHCVGTPLRVAPAGASTVNSFSSAASCLQITRAAMKHRSRRLLSSAILVICASGPVAAADLLGFYVGGAVGQAQVAAEVPNPFIAQSDTFKQTHSAFKLMVGVRPISFVGAEISYMDFGDPSGSLFGYSANVSMKGESAFGLLYLPVPPIIDVFAKAGVARLQSAASGYAPNLSLVCVAGIPCGTSPFQLDETNTGFAAGAGGQLKFGRWAVRAEYERFNATGENPYLLSLGFTWTLL